MFCYPSLKTTCLLFPITMTLNFLTETCIKLNTFFSVKLIIEVDLPSGLSIFFKCTSTSLFTGSFSIFINILYNNSLRSGGTKDHFKRAKVPGTAPYWQACSIDFLCTLCMYNPDMGVSLVNSRDFSAIPLGPNFGPNDNYPVFIPNLLLWIPNSWINSDFAFEFRL